MPNLRGPELLIILLIVVLLFGAKRLPDMARSVGRSLRIFKAETKGLVDGETVPDDAPASPAQPAAISGASEAASQAPGEQRLAAGGAEQPVPEAQPHSQQA